MSDLVLVMTLFPVMISTQECVCDAVLVSVEAKGDEFAAVVDIPDTVFSSSPEREIILFAEFDKGFSGEFEIGSVEDFEGRGAFE